MRRTSRRRSIRVPFLVTVSALSACTSQGSPAAATGVGGAAAAGANVGGAAGTGAGSAAGKGGASSADAGVGGGPPSAGAGGGLCPDTAPMSGARCDPALSKVCTFLDGACPEQFSCLATSATDAGWQSTPSPPGGPCCPPNLPPMGDPCPIVGVTCDYTTKDGGCPGGYGHVGVCGPFGWYPSPRSGGCNPPPPCPMAEPVASTSCPSGGFGAPLPTGRLCRYGRGACFTYWSCSADTYIWQSQNGTADGCCSADEPAPASSCPTIGSSCTYASDLATCGADGWTITALPIGNGGSSGSGAAGSGGGGG